MSNRNAPKTAHRAYLNCTPRRLLWYVWCFEPFYRRDVTSKSPIRSLSCYPSCYWRPLGGIFAWYLEIARLTVILDLLLSSSSSSSCLFRTIAFYKNLRHTFVCAGVISWFINNDTQKSPNSFLKKFFFTVYVWSVFVCNCCLALDKYSLDIKYI